MNNMTIRCAVVGGWFAALVTGCSSLPSVGPDYKEPKHDDVRFELPDAGSAATNDNRVVVSRETTAKWWTRFNDPLLERLVEGAVSNNVSYLMAKRRLEQANWQLLGSYAAFMPQVGVGADWNRYWNERNTRSGSGSYTHYNVRNFGIDGSWEIDIFGGNRRLLESSLAQAESAGWTLADAWVTLTTQIGRQYVTLRTTQERIEVARTNLVLQSETYDILKSRLDSGIGDELAVNQCAYIVEETRARIPTLLAQEEALKNAIAILVGAVPGALHEDLKPVSVRRDWLLQPQKVAELPLEMLRARPDVKAAERALAAQVARIGVAKAQWFPRLFVTGTVGWENKSSTPLFDGASFFASLGPSVSWPIFQGGAIYANVKATEAKAEELALAYGLSLQTAYAEVRNAYSAYTQEYHRYKALKGAVKAATDAVTISKDLYKNGLKDFNNVLDAQRSRLQYEESFALSRGQITIDLIDLYKSLGGGLEYPTAPKLDDEKEAE